MNDLQKELSKVEKEWMDYADQAVSFLKKAPSGNIKCTRTGGKYDQFLISDSDEELPKHYASTEKKELVQKLVQKDYYRKLLRYIDPALRKLHSFMKWYDPDQINRIYAHLPEARKKLAVPVLPNDEDFIRKWKSSLSSHQNDYPLSDNIITNRNESVRSKSEKIIADKLNELAIPYVYEAPLTLKGLGTIYPDFTVLNVRTRKTFYFEHFGMMDDPEYVEKALRKIAAYAGNDFWFGDGLLYTFESQNFPLHTGWLDRMIREYLL